jgi:hypothetical protein
MTIFYDPLRLDGNEAGGGVHNPTARGPDGASQMQDVEVPYFRKLLIITACAVASWCIVAAIVIELKRLIGHL